MVDDPIDRPAHHLAFFIWVSELEYTGYDPADFWTEYNPDLCHILQS